MLIEKRICPKSTTLMILISLKRVRVPTFLKTTLKCIKKPECALPLLGQTSMTFVYIHAIVSYPEVFHANCICDTNNTNNHLLTFSCQTSTGKQVVFLRIWLPKQKRFRFHWAFKFVLTNIFDASAFRRTQLFLVDGDPQQKAELSKDILDYSMPNAINGSCGWHIVMEQGWKAHGPEKIVVKDNGYMQDKYYFSRSA
jgi:hypothetical protein